MPLRRTSAARAALLAIGAGCVLCACACGSGGSSPAAGGANTATAETSTTVRTTGLKPNKPPKYGAPAPGSPVHSGAVQIVYRNLTIDPDTLRVKVGSTIRWRNEDPIEHNVTSSGGPQSFSSGNFGEGGTFAIRVRTPGVIHYLCTIHPTSMNGTIEVVR